MDLEDEKTPLEKLGIKIPDELDGLFGDPPKIADEATTIILRVLALRGRKEDRLLQHQSTSISSASSFRIISKSMEIDVD
jgi:hypothetical protein